MTYQKALTALSDPTRSDLFTRLAQKPSSVSALAKGLPVSRPAVSQHLKILSDAGLVNVRAEGTRRIYSVRPEALKDLRDWLDGLWSDALNAFAEAAEKEARS